jgi:hypothetical protein
MLQNVPVSCWAKEPRDASCEANKTKEKILMIVVVVVVVVGCRMLSEF